MDRRRRIVACSGLLVVAATLVLGAVGSPAGGQEGCPFSDCTVPTSAVVSSTTIGGSSTTVGRPGEGEPGTTVTTGGFTVGRPGDDDLSPVPTSDLPVTGSDAVSLVLVGIGAVGVGALLVRAGRRRDHLDGKSASAGEPRA